MKGFSLLPLVAMLLFCPLSFADEQSDAELRTLRAESELNRKTSEERLQEVKALKAQVAELIKAIESLTADKIRLAAQVKELGELCLKAGIEVPNTADGPAQAPVPVIYLGKTRTPAWFDATYSEFSDKIAMIDGKYVDIGRAVLKPDDVDMNRPESGTEYRKAPTGCKVLQIVRPDAAIIVKPQTERVSYSRLATAFLFRVKGLDTDKLADGADYSAKLVYSGTYRFIAPGGGEKTIPSYIVHKQLTRGQFAEAIASGFKLIRYRLSSIAANAGMIVAAPVE